MNRTTIFVYGTLKRGQKNEYLMAGQEYLQTVRTMPIYRLYSLGSHPGMVIDTAHGLSIEGELWAVDDETLAKLDEFEGVPHWYDRRSIALRDTTVDATGYIYLGEIPSGAYTGYVWPFPS
jgi:gamma-glutamylaminecyclotransferase